MVTYEETCTDLENSIGIVPRCLVRLPEKVLVSYWPYLKRYQLEESETPQKYRELIALSAIATLRCRSCLSTFIQMAKNAGATSAEVSEAISLTNHAVHWHSLHHPSGKDTIVIWEETEEYRAPSRERDK